MISSIHTLIHILLLLTSILEIRSSENDYLRYVKDGCFLKGEVFSCVKYKALKIAKKTLFGGLRGNETIRANQMISFVPLDEETVEKLTLNDDREMISEPRGFFSEWAELTKYAVKLVKEFFKVKGLRVNLPEGARTVEEEDSDDARGKRKKLAIVIPLLTLLAAVKAKVLLIPVLLSVLLIKKLLLVAAFLLPSLLSTLKACKHHQHHPMTHYAYVGSDSSDFNSDYNGYSYSTGSGYTKDWASNRAYNLHKHRPTPAPVYITAPGPAV